MFARFLIEQGFSLETISAILNHTKLNTTLAFCSIFPCEEPEIGMVIGNTLEPVFESGDVRTVQRTSSDKQTARMERNLALIHIARGTFFSFLSSAITGRFLASYKRT